MAKITMTVQSTVYGRRVARCLVSALSLLGFPERFAVRAGLCMTLIRLRMGGKHVAWHWLGRRN